MTEVIINFNDIFSEEELYKMIDDTLKISVSLETSIEKWSFGIGPDSFLDLYSYWQDEDYFIISNYMSIKDKLLKERASVFVSKVLPATKETNPNFDYVTES